MVVKPRALWQASKASTVKFWVALVAEQWITIRLIFLIEKWIKDFFSLIKIVIFSTPLSPSCEEGVLNPHPSPLLFQKGEGCSWLRYSFARVLVSAAEPVPFGLPMFFTQQSCDCLTPNRRFLCGVTPPCLGLVGCFGGWLLLLTGYLQLCTQNAEVMAVRTVMMKLMMDFQVSFFMFFLNLKC